LATFEGVHQNYEEVQYYSGGVLGRLRVGHLRSADQLALFAFQKPLLRRVRKPLIPWPWNWGQQHSRIISFWRAAVSLSGAIEAMGVAKNSPVGRLMVAILDEGTASTLPEAYELAKVQLWKAAGRKHYKVMTPRQDKARAERLKAQVNATLESGKSGHSGPRSLAPETSSSSGAPQTAPGLLRYATAHVPEAPR
jgi:hypothetical protein